MKLHTNRETKMNVFPSIKMIMLCLIKLFWKQIEDNRQYFNEIDFFASEKVNVIIHF